MKVTSDAPRFVVYVPEGGTAHARTPQRTVPDDRILPATIERQCCPGGGCSVTLTLGTRFVGEGRTVWLYRRADNHQPFGRWLPVGNPLTLGQLVDDPAYWPYADAPHVLDEGRPEAA